MERAIFKIFPKGKEYKRRTVEDSAVFTVLDARQNVLGYAFLAQGNGYQGTIKMMAGIKTDLRTLTGLEILESQETPGLGQEITGASFKGQFNGLKAQPAITYVKNRKPTKPNEIEAITGATISSRAVVSILNETIQTLQKHLTRK